MKDWKKVKLGDLLTESKIVSEKPDANKRLTVRLHTEGIEKRPFSKDKKGATKYYIRSKGQFIYGRQNLHKGAFGIVPDELDGFESSADIPAFDVDQSCLPEWIYYFFKKGNFYLKLESLAKGVGSKRINPSLIFGLDILLPPIEEQKSLLERVSELKQKNDKVKNEFEKQIEYINQLRQSVLTDATNGLLTRKWREKNSGVKSGEDLLEKIRAVKAELVSNKIIKEEIVGEIKEEEKPYTIPKTWRWCRFVEIIEQMSYGTSHRTNDDRNNVPVFRMGNITANGELIFDNFKYLAKEDKDLPRLYLEQNDILFNRTNSFELVGKCAVFKGEKNKFTLASYLIKVSPLKAYVDSDYICNYIMSPICRKTQIEPYVVGQAGQSNYSGTKLKNLFFPLPPFAEQKEISNEVKRIKSHCDNLEKEAISNLANAQKVFGSSIIELLGGDLNILQKVEKTFVKKLVKRVIIFDSKTTLMDLVELLQKHRKLHAEDLWKMSKFPENIDAFYAELKHQIENKKSIKEVENEKGYLELV